MPPDQLVLAFDTSAAHCAAALLCGDQVLAEQIEPMQKGQAERLFPILEELLQVSGKSWEDLDRIGVGIGPGNYTGTRISVASARGLALALDIPAIGVSTFEALGHGMPRPVFVRVNGLAGQAYVQFLASDGNQEPYIAGADFAGNLTGKARTVVVEHGKKLDAQSGMDIVEPMFSLPVSIALVAQSKNAGECERPAPLYLKSADANPPKISAPTILS